ncbi:MAG: sugar phosphate isomerase/epimerase [Syntrophaceae bacterium]|nr:sugar phosphate isomerase/epimerase [Syntrophaceae bacterium]
MITIGGRAHNLDEALSVSKLGLSFIEISLDDPAIVSGWVPQLLEIKNNYRISLLAHYPNEDNPFDVEILRNKFLPRIKGLMEISRQLDITKATLHFWMDKRWAAADLIRGKLEILKRIVDFGNDFGITVCIENLSERADSFAPAFEAIPGLKMTLDIGHAQLLARQNTSFRFIEEHFPRIAHIHVHDNRGGTSVKDDLHLALGEGSVDYKTILKALISKHYDSTMTMEVKIKDMLKTKQILEDCIR